MRTTVNIDDVVLKELKRLQRRQKKPLGRLMSELLAQAMGSRGSESPPPAKFKWTTRHMGARVDLDDREAIYAAMDEIRVAEPPPDKEP